jgi:hypothetical protein
VWSTSGWNSEFGLNGSPASTMIKVSRGSRFKEEVAPEVIWLYGPQRLHGTFWLTGFAMCNDTYGGRHLLLREKRLAAIDDERPIAFWANNERSCSKGVVYAGNFGASGEGSKGPMTIFRDSKFCSLEVRLPWLQLVLIRYHERSISSGMVTS